MPRRKSIPNRITHLYNLAFEGKTVLHFNLQEKHPKSVILSQSIKIAEDKGYYNLTGSLYKLHVRGAKRWSRALTYLKPVKNNPGLFTGKIKTKKDFALVIFLLPQERHFIIIDVYKDYYPADEVELQNVLEQHPYFDK